MSHRNDELPIGLTARFLRIMHDWVAEQVQEQLAGHAVEAPLGSDPPGAWPPQRRRLRRALLHQLDAVARHDHAQLPAVCEQLQLPVPLVEDELRHYHAHHLRILRGHAAGLVTALCLAAPSILDLLI
jgi:hypothetical protein